MTYPPPPYGPPPPYNAPPAGGRGKTIAVIVVGVVVAFLVCIGGVITTVVVLANQDDEPQAATAGGAPTGVAQGGGPGVNCKVVAVPDGKAVGRPDFGRAGARTVTMTLTTNEGAVTVTMDRAKAPCTVASFEHLAGSGFFDDSPCHRLTAEGAFYRFTDENLDGARYTRGVVAMANAGPDTNGSQFFIIYRDSEIAPNYTVFGQVSAGLDVVDRVAAAGVAPGGNSPVDGRPQLEVTLRSVTVR